MKAPLLATRAIRRLRKRITYANVMSTIACFAALSTGSAYAITMFTGANIKDGTLTGADLKTGSVGSTDIAGLTGADINNGSLTGTKLAAGTVTSNNIANGGVGGLDIADGAITADHLGAGSVTEDALEESSVTGNAIADGSINTEDISEEFMAFLNSLSAPAEGGDEEPGDGDSSSTTCEREGAEGTVLQFWDENGWGKIFCEIPLAPDEHEPNNTEETATELVLYETYSDITLDSATDEDYFTTTIPCPETLHLSSSGKGSSFVYYDIWVDGVKVLDGEPSSGVTGTTIGGDSCGEILIRAYASPDAVSDSYGLYLMYAL